MTQPAGSEPEGDASGRPASAREITRLLDAHAAGDREALDRLIPLVYDDLRRIAHNRLRSERASHTLDTTAVVHEAYLRLVDVSDPSWNGRAHFFAVSSKLIRNLLIDYARRRKADKRGGGAIKIPLSGELDAVGDEPRSVDLLALDEALTALALRDPRLEQVVECRFFGGLSVRETAGVLDVSVRTVERDWTRAKAYLYRALSAGTPPSEPAG
ncbi:MAG: sigma-70 family RNA polymerase sigma factor [Gemmatimonadales bacterium]